MSRLKAICQNLARIENHTVTDLFELAVTPDYLSKKERELNNLISFAKTDPKVLALVEKYKAGDSILKKIYDQLLLYGAGRYARGYWVAGASLVFPNTLEALIKNFDGDKFVLAGHTEKNSGLKVAYRMFTYFSDAENQPIEEI